MVYPEPGKGQVYMTTKRDSQGHLLRADKTYRLRVPTAVPVKQFWALTLYSEDTRRPYDNGESEPRRINLDSRDEMLTYNPDGSVDLYIGPIAPVGMEHNWMRTVGQDGWFVYFRLYAPTEPFFDKQFALPDFEEVEGMTSPRMRVLVVDDYTFVGGGLHFFFADAVAESQGVQLERGRGCLS